MRVLTACLGLVLERASLKEVLLRQANLVIRRVTLRLGVEWQRHFVRGRRPYLVLKLQDSEDGAVVTLRDRRWR